ncbi:ParA family protein [Telmatocola sphagniphila]|uniref:ParA family protein n=1 Tax=Telmatocola sphagniphila TaxID=1123043 RepID=A0A8E6EUL3_9BACT|nr:ParA family protein [Telmatocola sphagniphila]QVL31417.1 ParA family protein [Telmatocola sphagniphila]
MHKLLIASQKGGVGKTTTVVNLAMIAATAGRRVLLVDADPLGSVSACLKLSRKDGRGQPDPVSGKGWWWKAVLPNLDVVTPYAATSQSDEDLKAFLEKFPESDFHNHFEQVFVDSPPALLGDRTKTLLRTCDDLLIVIRAEPMAYRTLPGYLEELQEAQKEGASCQLKGILLTMPQGMEEDSEWEHQLRTRFGKNVFAEIVPYDPEANQAVLVGKPITLLSPESPAAKVYISLASSLGILKSQKPRKQNLENTSVSPELVAPLPRFQQSSSTTSPAPSRSGSKSSPSTPTPTPTRRTTPVAAKAVAVATRKSKAQVVGEPVAEAVVAPVKKPSTQPNLIILTLGAIIIGLATGVIALYIMR